jgi:hypothetical protein
LEPFGFVARVFEQQGDYTVSWDSVDSDIADGGIVVCMRPNILKNDI